MGEDMSVGTEPARWPQPRTGSEDATLAWLDALAGGICTPEAFLVAMSEQTQGKQDEGWEVLSLLDQYYRRGKIKGEVFHALKTRLEGAALNKDKDAPKAGAALNKDKDTPKAGAVLNKDKPKAAATPCAAASVDGSDRPRRRNAHIPCRGIPHCSGSGIREGGATPRGAGDHCRRCAAQPLQGTRGGGSRRNGHGIRGHGRVSHRPAHRGQTVGRQSAAHGGYSTRRAAGRATARVSTPAIAVASEHCPGARVRPRRRRCLLYDGIAERRASEPCSASAKCDSPATTACARHHPRCRRCALPCPFARRDPWRHQSAEHLHYQ